LSDGDLAHRVQGLLGAHHVMTLATAGARGPWAAAVFYVHADWTLYFLSSPKSRHAGELALDARVALTIHGDCSDWSQIKGLQIEGSARRLETSQEATARALYAARFPLVGALGAAPAALREAFARVGWYAVEADRVCLIDNARGFGHREELRVK
jgi:uncharacterized protein YhbP (UPF0306 family)